METHGKKGFSGVISSFHLSYHRIYNSYIIVTQTLFLAYVQLSGITLKSVVLRVPTYFAFGFTSAIILSGVIPYRMNIFANTGTSMPKVTLGVIVMKRP